MKLHIEKREVKPIPEYIIMTQNEANDPVFLSKLGAILYDDPKFFTPKP